MCHRRDAANKQTNINFLGKTSLLCIEYTYIREKDAESLHSPSTEGCRITAQSKYRRMQNHCTVQVQKDAESLHSPSTEGCRITAQSKYRRMQNHCTVQVQKDAESQHSPSTEGCRITAQKSAESLHSPST